MNLKKKSGFTLMEMLVVVCIIAILLSIATPAFQKALNYARASSDAANVRAAKAAALAEYYYSNRKLTTFYFDGTATRTSHTGIKGYGQSRNDLPNADSDIDDDAEGRPLGAFVQVDVLPGGVAKAYWVGADGTVPDPTTTPTTPPTTSPTTTPTETTEATEATETTEATEEATESTQPTKPEKPEYPITDSGVTSWEKIQEYYEYLGTYDDEIKDYPSYVFTIPSGTIISYKDPNDNNKIKYFVKFSSNNYFHYYNKHETVPHTSTFEDFIKTNVFDEFGERIVPIPEKGYTYRQDTPLSSDTPVKGGDIWLYQGKYYLANQNYDKGWVPDIQASYAWIEIPYLKELYPVTQLPES